MKNRVYYGEYSLRHWIDLILRKNIILPEYQRHFVWNEQKVKNLIGSFKNKHFIPPVTIGSFNKDDDTMNIILDGQQRLTSILLAYIGLYPDVAVFKKRLEQIADENDDIEEAETPDGDGDDHGLDNILEWDLSKLTSKGRTRGEIIKKIARGNYKSIELDISDDFLEKNYLGFCYLVPQSDDLSEQQRYYSSVFRNINIQGQALLPQESRASLYFLDQDLVSLFSPRFFDNVKIKLISSEAKADFLRYLSLLSQYHIRRDSTAIARGYKQKMESLYEEYIYATINDQENNLFPKFSSIFPDRNYEDKLQRLDESMTGLALYKSYSSIIDVDISVFGVIYHILFANASIRVEDEHDIKQKIQDAIAELKGDEYHLKSPNNLKYLRSRITKSISIYGEHLE